MLRTKDEWNRALNASKVRVISALIDTRDQILTSYAHGSDERRTVGVDKLNAEEFYKLERRLNRLLAGEGAEGEGLIGEFLQADPTKYRDFVNNYGDGQYSASIIPSNEDSETVNVDSAYHTAVCLLLNRVWAASAPYIYENVSPEDLSETHEHAHNN